MKKKFAIAKQNKTKQNKQNGEGRRKAISIYTNNNNLTNLNAVRYFTTFTLGKKLCNQAREGGKTNLKKKKR